MTDIVLSSTDYKGIHGDIVAILESTAEPLPAV